MTSTLCRWCGRQLDEVKTADGRAVARQCPLCLEWAPLGEDVGKERPRPTVTSAERKARSKAAKARRDRQLRLFK